MTADFERLRDAVSRIGWYDARGQWVEGGHELAEVLDRLAAAERVIEIARRNVQSDCDGCGATLVSISRYEKAYLSEQSAPTAQNAHLSTRADLNSTATDRLQDPNVTERSQNLNSAKQEGE